MKSYKLKVAGGAPRMGKMDDGGGPAEAGGYSHVGGEGWQKALWKARLRPRQGAGPGEEQDK
ncbi:MAG: hypothetical protein JXR84_20915 [Anaerolineae bacterium]|nr:hypothetical protein [Anaerolineae bacterium]